MFTIGSFRARIPLVALWILAPIAAFVVGSFVSVRAEGSSQPPPVGDLRSAPDLRVLPGRTFNGLDELASYADFIGVVEVASVQGVKTGDLPSLTGNGPSIGYADVSAKVISVAAGNRKAGEQIAFNEDLWFKPGTTEFASPEVLPVVEPGRRYLVFIREGEVVYPGGLYAEQGGKVWFIGQWSSADSRSYPAGLSGMTVDAAIKLIMESRK